MKSFSERVIEIALSIPPGRVTTYGRIARAAGGGARASQSITSILSKACAAGLADIPFHRIVYSDGRIWLNGDDSHARMALYKKEGIDIRENGTITNFRDILFDLK